MIAVQGERVSRRIAIGLAALLFFAFVAAGFHLHTPVSPGERAVSSNPGGEVLAPGAAYCLLCHLARDNSFPVAAVLPFAAPADPGSPLSAPAALEPGNLHRPAFAPRAPPLPV